MTTTAKAPAFDAPASEWLVYADALQEARDPRGELITLVNAKKDSERDAHVAKHAAIILGEAGKDLARYKITWRHCLIDNVDVLISSKDNGEALVANILASPAASEVRSIRLVGTTDDRNRVDLGPAMVKLSESLPKTCHAVAFIDERATKSKMLISRDYEPDENLVRVSDLTPFFASKTVDSIEVDVADMNQLEFGTPIKAPNLKKFALRGLRYGEAYGDIAPLSNWLNAAEFSKLEDFELRLTEAFTANVPDEQEPYVAVYGDDEDLSDRLDEAEDGETEGTSWNRELEGLLKTLKKCPIQRLALTSFDTGENVLTALEADGGLPKTLKVLDLSDSTFDSSQVKWLEQRKELLAGLDTLVVERTRLSDDDAVALEKLGPKKVVHSHSESSPTYRFVVGME